MPSAIHYIDSQYRLNPALSTTTDFQHMITIPRGHNRCALYAITIPKSYYLINAPYNTFTLTDQADMTTYTITLEIGNYSISEFVSALNTLLLTPTNLHIAVAFLPRTGKLQFTTSSNRHYTSSFNSKLKKILGLTEDPEFIHSNPPYVSANIVNFQPLNTVSVICDMVSGSSFGETNSLLHQVYVNLQGDFSYILYENRHPMEIGKNMILDTSNTINPYSIKIALLDEDEMPLSTNGLDIDLQIITYYEPDNPPDEILFNLIRDYTQYRKKVDERKDFINSQAQ